MLSDNATEPCGVPGAPGTRSPDPSAVLESDTAAVHSASDGSGCQSADLCSSTELGSCETGGLNWRNPRGREAELAVITARSVAISPPAL